MTDPAHQGIIDAIRVLRIELQIANDKVAAAVGLNPRDLDILDVIDREHPCTPTHLAQRTGVSRATLTGVLARLEDAGWISRVADPADRRSVYLTPTSRFDALRTQYATGDQQIRSMAAELPDSTRRDVEKFLHQAAEVMRGAASEAAHANSKDFPQPRT